MNINSINCMLGISHANCISILALSKSISHSVMSNPLWPIYCSPPGFSVHGLLQATLEWVVISFSRGSSWLTDQSQLYCIAGRLFTDWVTLEAPVLSKVYIIIPIYRQENWNPMCLYLAGLYILTQNSIIFLAILCCSNEQSIPT